MPSTAFCHGSTMSALLSSCLLTFAADAGAAPAPPESVYVAPDGNDAWSGQLPAPNPARTDGPFRTLKQAAAALQPGQTCFLRQGVYRETLKPTRSGEPGRPLVFRNYQDEVAVISGADELGNWTPVNNGIWQAPMPWDLDDQNQLFAAGTMLNEARWPHNTGTLLQPTRAAAAAGTPTSLADPQLPGSDGAWNGALLWCAGGDRWICWAEKITGFSALTKTLTFTPSKNQDVNWYHVRPGSRYVLMGVRAALGAAGEWWYDREKQQLLLIPPTGVDLKAASIEAKRRLHCIDLAGLSYVDIVGLHFRAGGVLTDDRTANIRLVQCHGEYVAHSYLREVGGQTGVLIRGRDNEVNSCELAWSSTSILAVAGSGHRIVNCYLHDGNYGGKWQGAVALSGRQILFSHNTARNSGRDLLSIHGLMESLIQYNDLSDAGWLTCDLGMTYGHSTDFMNTVIRYNVVHDNRAEGCAMGIYFDHCSHNVIVHHNLVYNTGFDPIRVNNPSYYDLVFNNSAFATGGVSTFDHSHRDDLFGLRFANNLFNQEITLPAAVALDHNLISSDPGYAAPAQRNFTLKPGSPALGAGVVLRGIADTTDARPPDAGAFPSGQASWKAGHDFANPPNPEWEAANCDWMNLIRNGCFELATLENWTVMAPGAAALVPGNGWGNAIYGGVANDATGTSKRELRLGPGRAAVEQVVHGLYAATTHQLAGWLKVSAAGESVRLGLRAPDGTETWSSPVTTTVWKRVTVAFTTAPAQTSVTVVIAKTTDTGGYANCDNLGLPRTPAGTRIGP